jgi:hypothetical protein
MIIIILRYAVTSGRIRNQLNPFEKQNDYFSRSTGDDDDSDDAKSCDLLNNAALPPHTQHTLRTANDSMNDAVVIQLTSTNQYFSIKLLYICTHSFGGVGSNGNFDNVPNLRLL